MYVQYKMHIKLRFNHSQHGHMKLYDLNSMLNIDTNYQLKTATYVQDPHERQEKYLKI